MLFRSTPFVVGETVLGETSGCQLKVIAPDGKFMIFWMEDAWPASSLKFTKIDSEGNIEIGWNPNGNSLSNPSYDSRNLTVKSVADESGVLAIWTQDGNFSDIYAQMISWDGDRFVFNGYHMVGD